jgi:hypothetical protein
MFGARAAERGWLLQPLACRIAIGKRCKTPR